MSAFAQQQSIAFRANVVAKSISSKKQSKKIQRSLRVEAAKKSVGDLSKSDLEGTFNARCCVFVFHLSSCIFAWRNAMRVRFYIFSRSHHVAEGVYSFI